MYFHRLIWTHNKGIAIAYLTMLTFTHINWGSCAQMFIQGECRGGVKKRNSKLCTSYAHHVALSTQMEHLAFSGQVPKCGTFGTIKASCNGTQKSSITHEMDIIRTNQAETNLAFHIWPYTVGALEESWPSVSSSHVIHALQNIIPNECPCRCNDMEKKHLICAERHHFWEVMICLKKAAFEK